MGQAKRKKIEKISGKINHMLVKAYQDKYLDSMEVNTAEHIALELTHTILVFDRPELERETVEAAKVQFISLLYHIILKYSMNEEILKVANQLKSAFEAIETSHVKETDQIRCGVLVAIQVLLHEIKKEEENG